MSTLSHTQRAAYLNLTPAMWKRKIAAAEALADPCCLCPRRCRALRGYAGEPAPLGICQTGRRAVVASYGPHFGEEDPLVGTHGSGTIFFSHCSLLCIYCQNYQIAHFGEGRALSNEDLALLMLRLQAQGCHNINLVTPTHVVPNILSAVRFAAEQGLTLPLIYNTGGYDSPATLRLLDGVIDIYMPDMKYSDPRVAKQLSQASDYPKINFAAVREMHRQVGDLKINSAGIATRGLLVRHLVLPNGLAGSEAIFRFLAEEISPNTYLNIMKQYRPYYRAQEHPGLCRRVTEREYEDVLGLAVRYGLKSFL